MEIIGFRLKKSRRSIGCTQGNLANKLGITSVTVVEWEKGRAEPKPSVLLKWAELTNVSPGWLLTGEGEMKAGEGGQTAFSVAGQREAEGKRLGNSSQFDEGVHINLELILKEGDDYPLQSQIINDIRKLSNKIRLQHKEKDLKEEAERLKFLKKMDEK